MKWLSILKSKSGKFVMTAQNALIASAMVTAGAVTVFHNIGANLDQQPPAVRAVFGVTDPVNTQGMKYDARTGYSSIQVRDGLGEMATPRDLRRMARQDPSAGDFGIEATEGIEGRISVGPAAQGGASEGLGMGANNAVETGAVVTSTGGPGIPGPRPMNLQSTGNSGDNGGAAGGAAGGASGRQFAPASMAHATGSSVHSAAGAQIGGGNNRSMSTGGRPVGNSEAYNFTGAMPNGSNVVSSLSDSGAGARNAPSHFVPGSRNARIGQGGGRRNIKGNDAYVIAKRSAQLAKDINGAANKGGRAFLDGSPNSGGVNVEGGVEGDSATSDDFDSELNEDLSKLNKLGKNIANKDAERDKHRKRLINRLLLMLGTALVALPLASLLLKSSDLAWWNYALAAALCLSVIGLAGWVIANAVSFNKHFHSPIFSGMMELLGVGAIAAATCTFATKGALWKYITTHLKGLWDKAMSFFIMPAATTVVQSAVSGEADQQQK